MKKSVVFLTALLLASIAGTYAVYELYVKQRMKELGEHMKQEALLRNRIEKLDREFFGTEPPVVLGEWRRSTQPWSDAVENRLRFFTLGPLAPSVEIPEEKLARFFYRDELPKRIQDLEDYAAQKNVQVADVDCGVPPFDGFPAGTNPSPERIKALLEQYDYCAALTRLMIDAGPQSIDPLEIWPEREVKVKSRGTIKLRSTGVKMLIRTEPLVRFLDGLAQSNRYVRVDTIRIANSDLTAPDPLLDVELVMTQTLFEEEVRRLTDEEQARVNQQAEERLNELFGGGAGGTGGRGERDEEPTRTWWQRWRRILLPF
jgi:hypothetical protein